MVNRVETCSQEDAHRAGDEDMEAVYGIRNIPPGEGGPRRGKRQWS